MDDELAPRLSAVRWVTDAVALEEVDSTNLEAARRIEQGAGNGLVVTAQRQTAGRGRRGRSWSDVAGGNLALSAVVELPERATLLPLAAGLALREALTARGVTTAIKWPNDVRAVVDGHTRKCAGILVETRPGGDGRDLAIVGIGVDVDWRDVTRDEQSGDWTSVAELVGDDVDVAGIAVDLVAGLGRWVATLRRDPDAVRAAVVEACDTLGRRVRVERDRDTVSGLAVDLDAGGALLLDVDGRELSVTAGDVVHLHD